MAESPPGGETLQRMAAADAYNAWLLDRSGPLLERRVLDAGAGIGTFTGMLADRCDSVVALEPDTDAAAVLRRRFADRDNVEVVEADVTALDPGAAPGPFDAVVCFNVLEHVADEQGAVAALRDRLRRGGRLLLLVPAHEALRGSIDATVGHLRRYEKRRLRRLLGDAGLEVERLRHVNPVGALGWLVAARVLRSQEVPGGPLVLYDRLVPLLRLLDRVELPFGLSLWAVARRR